MKGILIFITPPIVGCYISDVWDNIAHLPEDGGVYLLTETKIGKQYVGSSINVRKRVLAYMMPNAEAYHKPLFIGVNPRYLKAELVEACNDTAILLQREAYWINKMNTGFPNGLNAHSPKNQKSVYGDKYYKVFLKNEYNYTPCYQLLKFTERLDFFIDKVNSTPINKKWFKGEHKGNETHAYLRPTKAAL